MHAFSYFLPEARSLIRPIWSVDGTRMAISAVKWLYSEEGAAAYVRFVERMLDNSLPFEMARMGFRLEVEIAARKEGWCPELPAQPRHADFDDAELMITDC